MGNSLPSSQVLRLSQCEPLSAVAVALYLNGLEYFQTNLYQVY